MMSQNTRTISTPANGRAIRQLINTLLKSGAITEATKLTYAKHYTLVDKQVIASNIQILTLTITDKREKIGPGILSKFLKDRETIQ